MDLFTIGDYVFHAKWDLIATYFVFGGVIPCGEILLKRITGHSNFKILNDYYQFNATDLVNIADDFNPLQDFVQKEKKFK